MFANCALVLVCASVIWANVWSPHNVIEFCENGRQQFYDWQHRTDSIDSSTFVYVSLFGFGILSKFEVKMSERPEDHRRKWDRDEFERLAADRLREELELEDKKNKKGKISYF